MTDNPAPLVSPEIDLRDFPYMPLDVVRLRDSDLAGNPDGEVFRAAVLSWCVSWHQIPAASLPDDDALLARLLGYGRDVKGWSKLRAAGALHKWVKCSDGRLYHPTVAEKANDAWQSKLSQRNRTEKARLAKLSQSQSQGGAASVTERQVSVTETVTGSKGEEGKGEDINHPHSRSDGSPEPTTAAPVIEPTVISLPTNRFETTGEQVLVLEKQVVDFEQTYPGVDVRQQLRSMRAWLIANPVKRKTRTGMMAFVNKWLSKEQNSGGNRGVFNGQPGDRNNTGFGALARGMAAAVADYEH